MALSHSEPQSPKYLRSEPCHLDLSVCREQKEIVDKPGTGSRGISGKCRARALSDLSAVTGTGLVCPVRLPSQLQTAHAPGTINQSTLVHTSLSSASGSMTATTVFTDKIKSG